MTPKQLKPMPGEEPRTAFAGDNPTDPADYTLLDRSTLEQWGQCPAQAAWVASGQVNTSSDIANAGEEVHKAFAAGITEWIAERGAMTLRQLRDFVQGELLFSRPDVQPEAIAAARRSLYDWAEFITTSVDWESVLHYDGGEGALSGQLAYDIPAFECRPTSEVDLLFSTTHPELLFEIDYKSGRKLHTMQSVKDSLQFQMHAALVFEKYTDVTGLHVQIWQTRSNSRSYAAEFLRKDLPQYRARIKMAAAAWYQYRNIPPDVMTEAWPSVEKCRLCAAAHLCPKSGTLPLVGEWAAEMLRSYIALTEKTKRVKDWLADYTDQHGDIKLPSGECFGRVATSKPTCKLYQQKGETE